MNVDTIFMQLQSPLSGLTRSIYVVIDLNMLVIRLTVLLPVSFESVKQKQQLNTSIATVENDMTVQFGDLFKDGI